MRTLGMVLAGLLMVAVAAAQPSANRHELRSGWEIQSSCKLSGQTGAELSSARFQPKGWIKTSVPSTVLAVQVANKLAPDPMYGMNLRSIPGGDYPIGKNFSNLPMPDNSPYRCSWWYRTEFTVPAAFHGKHIALHCDGINYRANIWLNGKQIANSNDVVGTWRIFDFDVTDALHTGENALAVEVFAPIENDLALTWVDWAPAPPDKDMGLWRPVYLTAADLVTIRRAWVKTEIEPDHSVAHLTAYAELSNVSDEPVRGMLTGEICCVPLVFRVNVQGRRTEVKGPEKEVPEDLETAGFMLTPHETQVIALARFDLKNPQLWWPAELGKPELYQLDLEAATTRSGALVIADHAKQTFGIRQVTSQLINGQRQFFINGKPLLIRGGGWAPDLLLREDHQRMEDQFRMTRDMGLNTIRLEGKLENDEFYDLADRYGILVMAGWCCCDMWEKWDKWTDETQKVATASLADQIRRLRQHPSVFVWLNGSDNPPPANVEQMYLDRLKKYDWPNPVVSSATNRVTEVSGPSGVKMNGPYDYVPPNYWLEDSERGGAFGFATEISPGPAIPTLQSIERFIPRDHLWPATTSANGGDQTSPATQVKDDEYWKYHAGGGQFATINIYSNALDQRYGPSTSLSDFVRKSQAAAYEGQRAMFEGYTRNKWTAAGAAQHSSNPTPSPDSSQAVSAPAAKPWPATGVIQWMLNNAWPSMIWHLYDYFLVPGGGYYGTKEATKPLHVQYSYDDHSVVVVSGPGVKPQRVTVTAERLNLSATLKHSGERAVEITPDAVTPAGITVAADDAALGKTFFLRLQLKDADGKLVDENLYWLSTRPDTLDQQHGTWYYTPQAQYADLTGLSSLPAVKLATTSAIEHHGSSEIARVHLRNPSKNLAFMVHLRISRGEHGDDLAPVFWDDNYVSIFPGEERTINGSFDLREAGKSEAVVHIDGWNVAPEVVAAQASSHPAAAH